MSTHIAHLDAHVGSGNHLRDANKSTETLARSQTSQSAANSEDHGEWTRCSRDALIERIRDLLAENTQLASKLATSSDSLNELTQRTNAAARDLLYSERHERQMTAHQIRLEEDLANRIQFSDKMRTQVRELERESREAMRKYREQASSFEAERQNWLDTETHLKMRITSLTETAARLSHRSNTRSAVPNGTSDDADTDNATTELAAAFGNPPAPAGLPAEWQSRQASGAASKLLQRIEDLQIQYSALLTSHESLELSHRLLQEETTDLKRVNQSLSDDKESYEILLRERTLTGLLGQGNFGPTISPVDADSPSATFEIQDSNHEEHERVSLAVDRSLTTNMLAQSGKAVARAAIETGMHSPVIVSGQNLATELGRSTIDVDVNFNDFAQSQKLVDDSSEQAIPDQVQHLRSQLSAKVDENKALSLYIARILDKIQASDAFESILSREGPSTGLMQHRARKSRLSPSQHMLPHRMSADLASISMFPNYSESSTPPLPTLPSASIETWKPSSANQHRSYPHTPVRASGADSKKSNRLSLSAMAASLFSPSGTERLPDSFPPPPIALKPMLLGARGPVTSAKLPTPNASRLLDNHEDEEDRRERERLHSELRLLGYSPTSTRTSPALMARSPPNATNAWSADSSPALTLPIPRRMSPTSQGHASRFPHEIQAEAFEARELQPSPAHESSVREQTPWQNAQHTQQGIGSVGLGLSVVNDS